MRPLLISATVLNLSAVVSSQLILPLIRGHPKTPHLRSHGDGGQLPLNMDPVGPGPAMPPSNPAPEHPSSGSGGDVMLSDVMGKERSINLFAGYVRQRSIRQDKLAYTRPYSFVRDIESASQRLDDSSKNTTVLAPLNSAIERLPRKPWEDPRDYGALGPNAYEGEDGQDRANQNLRRFVEEHMVPMNPWPEGKNAKAIGDDQTIWWEDKNGIKVVSNKMWVAL